MNIIIKDGTGMVSEHLKQQFQEIIFKKYSNKEYQEFIERIDTKDILYRIKFEVSDDSLVLLIHITEYKEFKKNH